jgi:hypothetical protein
VTTLPDAVPPVPPEWLTTVPDFLRILPHGRIVMYGEDWGVSVHRFRVRFLDRPESILGQAEAGAQSLGCVVDRNPHTGAVRFEHRGWTCEAQPWGVYVHLFVTSRTPPAPADGARALARTLREFRPFADFAEEHGCEITEAARFDFATGNTFGHLCFEQMGLDTLVTRELPGFLARRGFLHDAGEHNVWTLGERSRVKVTPLGQDEMRVEIPGLADFERFAEEALRGV